MAGNFWKDYFSFSKKERISVYALIIVIGASIAIPYWYRKSFSPPVVNAALQKQLDTVLLQPTDAPTASSPYQNTQISNNTSSAATLFYFDPNTLDAEGFKKLGLRDKTIQTIINYRSKGGHFKQPEDIRKIYGLYEDEATALIPYIRIGNSNTQPQQTFADAAPQKPKQIFKKIDINTATEEDWKAFPGIGEVLSKRIVKFRNSVHGFSSVNDVKKTYGLPDSVFQSILPYLSISDSTQIQ